MKSTDKTLEATKGQAVTITRMKKADHVVHACAGGYSYKLRANVPKIKYELLLEYKKSNVIIKDYEGNKLETVTTTIDTLVKKSGKGKKSSNNKTSQELQDPVSGEVLPNNGDKRPTSHTQVDGGDTAGIQPKEVDKDV